MSNVIREVVRHKLNVSPEHWKAVMPIMTYVSGTKTYGIAFEHGRGLGVSVYADSGDANGAEDRQRWAVKVGLNSQL